MMAQPVIPSGMRLTGWHCIVWPVNAHNKRQMSQRDDHYRRPEQALSQVPARSNCYNYGHASNTGGPSPSGIPQVNKEEEQRGW